MSDWREKAKLARQEFDRSEREKTEREQEVWRVKEEAQMAAINEAKAKELAAWVNKMGFRCHICDKPASGPYEWTSGQHIEDHGSVGGTFWDQPADLEKCLKCHKWTCMDHIESGICQKHIEKM